MSRIEECFAALRHRGEVGLAAFLTVGYPDLGATLDLVPALVSGGADLVELGVPFSDPLADGATIQRASFRALQEGVSLHTCFEVAAELRRREVGVPLLLMGYYNPIQSYGLERFCDGCVSSGVDGIIVADLPPEESGELRSQCRDRGIDFIALLAPTSTEERIAMACGEASGFIYCVSLTGVTGAREALPPGLSEFVARVRRHTSLPLAVGFGVSTRAHMEAIGRMAEAAVIGSALIDLIERLPPHERASSLEAYLRSLKGITERTTEGGLTHVV